MHTTAPTSLRSFSARTKYDSAVPQRFIAFITLVLPLWKGMSKYGRIRRSAFKTGRISSGKWSGCMYRSRTQKFPGTAESARNNCDKGLGSLKYAAFPESPGVTPSLPKAAKSCPIRLTSKIPFEKSFLNSATISGMVRLLRQPRISGMAQKEQQLLQPSVILRYADAG